MMGLFMEEIVLGQRYALGSYAFTHDNMLDYARRFDPVGFHVDEAAGRASPFGAMTAAGLHTACGWMVCYVASNRRAREGLAATGKVLPEVGPSPGFRHMRWHAPVLAGDVLDYFTTATSARALASRPGWGMVTADNQGINQRGELVFQFGSAVLTALKQTVRS